MSRRFYLDTNTYSYCLGLSFLPGWTQAGSDAVQTALLTAVRRNDILVLGSQFHLEEGSRIPDSARKAAFLSFFWECVRWYLLLPTSTLVTEEAQRKRPLAANEPFESFRVRQAARALCKNGQDLASIASAVAAFTAQGVSSGKQNRSTATKRLEESLIGTTTTEALKDWWSKAERQIEDWMRDYIRDSREHLKLPDDEALWPAPRDLQTAWSMHAYQMARVFMNVGLQRKIGPGDLHDAHHYAGACYGDVIVTDDGAFKDTLDIIPNRPIDVMSFNRFAAEVLGVTAK
jgi:hypothetical protein